MTDATLPAVPPSPVDHAGRPLVGLYVGALDEVRWGYPSGFWHGQVRRALGRRRWFQAGFTDGDALTVCRISDDGLTGGAFVWRADLRDGRDFLHTHIPGLPLANVRVGPIAGIGSDAFARLPHARVRLHRKSGEHPWQLLAQLPGVGLEVSLDPAGGPVPLVLIGEAGPIDGVYAQRYAGLKVDGHVRLRADKRPLGPEALGWLEYANGFFPKPFAWTTATIQSPELQAVLSDLDGLGDPTESALWRGPMPRALGRTRFDDWREVKGHRVPTRAIAPDAGEVRFEPRAIRQLSAGIGPSAVRWTFAGGYFSGSLDGMTLRQVPGLVEVRALGH